MISKEQFDILSNSVEVGYKNCQKTLQKITNLLALFSNQTLICHKISTINQVEKEIDTLKRQHDELNNATNLMANCLFGSYKEIQIATIKERSKVLEDFLDSMNSILVEIKKDIGINK